MDPQVEKIMATVAGVIGTQPSLGGTLKVDFGEPGSLIIDGSGNTNTISDGTGKTADCTVSLSIETLKQLRDHEIEPAAAFFKGRLRVNGDFGLAMKLGPILSGELG